MSVFSPKMIELCLMSTHPYAPREPKNISWTEWSDLVDTEAVGAWWQSLGSKRFGEEHKLRLCESQQHHGALGSSRLARLQGNCVELARVQTATGLPDQRRLRITVITN